MPSRRKPLLGQLLIAGFRKKPRSEKRKRATSSKGSNAPQATPVRPRRTSLSFFSTMRTAIDRTETRATPVIAFEEVEAPQTDQEVVSLPEEFTRETAPPTVIEEAPELPPLETLLPAPIHTHHYEGETLLAAQRLIRPDEKLKDSIEAFLMDQRSVHTRRAYEKDLKRFVGFLLVRGQNTRMDTIDRRLIVAYKDHLLGDKLQHTTIDRHLATLRSFFGWLLDDGLVTKNPAESVRFLNPKRLSKTAGLSDDEVRRILSIPDLHTRTGALHYCVLMVLFFCGLRRSELCELKTSNLGVERGHAVMRLRGKGNSERIIPLLPAVSNALHYYFRMTRKDPRVDQYLFTPVKNNRTQELDRHIDPSAIFYIVTRYAAKAGIMTKVSPHSCRATAISNARDQNVPDRAIQEFAGWSSTAMITQYDKRKTAVEKSAALAINYGTGDRAVPRREE